VTAPGIGLDGAVQSVDHELLRSWCMHRYASAFCAALRSIGRIVRAHIALHFDGSGEGRDGAAFVASPPGQTPSCGYRFYRCAVAALI